MKSLCISKYQRGLTLVELMIAMLLGLFLIGGLLQIFISSQQTYRIQEGLSRLQENGRFAMDFIIRDIRMAGFLGCQEAIDDLSIKPKVVLDAIVPVIPEPANADIITGDDSITNNWKVTACSNDSKCVAGTDVISMRYADSCGGYLTARLDSFTDDISIAANNSCGINVNDALIIANCSSGNIFRAAIDSTKTLIKHAAFETLYSKENTELFMYRDRSYFIRTSVGGGSALWMLDNTKASGGGNPVELVEGIEDMQILYGEDTDMNPATGESKNPLTGDDDYVPNYYVSANAVVDWARVISVRISLLVATIEEPASKPLSYTYNGETYDGEKNPLPTDRRLRRVFNSTIAVRNRVP